MPESKSSARASPKEVPPFVDVNGEMVEFTKAGNVSRMRAHRGNKPAIPQTHLCHLCPAKFTRITHLHRHLRTHTNERMHECERCHTQFTRSDLLTRHKRSCGDPAKADRSRRKSCQACADGKTKCDLQQPCSRCKIRDRECVYVRTPVTKPKRSPKSGARSGRSTQESEVDDVELALMPELHPVEDSTNPQLETIASSSSAPQLYPGTPDLSSAFGPHHASVAPSNTFHDFREADDLSSYESFSENTENVAQASTLGSFGLGSFAQDALEVNNQLNALFSTELFDKFFRDAFDESSVNSFDSPQGLSSVKDLLSIDSSHFPFPTDTTEMQPFMASAPPPDLSLFSLPGDFTSATTLSSTPAVPIFPTIPTISIWDK